MKVTPSERPVLSSRSSFSLLIETRIRAQCMGVRATHVFLQRPVQSAELVKCVRAILRKELGKHLAEDIARRLGMVRRSLERHLSAEGTTFREISREMQLQAAQRLLKTGASVSDVAKALGFSEVSAFTRAFRRWSGQPPSAWKSRCQRARQKIRRKHHGEVPGGMPKTAQSIGSRSKPRSTGL
jgi:AraC-like DNA-binding protein